MIIFVVIAIIAVLVMVVAFVAIRLARPVDGVAQFQRQIDALSPEARRPVVDQVAQLDDSVPGRPDEATEAPLPDAGPPSSPVDEPDGDEAAGDHPGDGDAPRPSS